MTPPRGFVLVRGRTGAIAIVRHEDREWFRGSELMEPERLVRAAGSFAGGRGATASIAAGKRRLRVKKYRRGGALAPILPDLFARRRRMMRDLQASLRAREHGVPCPLPVALVFERKLGMLWAGYLVSEEVPGAEPLDRALRSVDHEGGAVPLAMRAVRTVRRMHDAGILHADLNLGNLLVTSDEVHVIDLDGAAVAASASVPRRFANLSRLDRSYVKIFGASGPLSHADRQALLDAYAADDRQMAAALRALVPRHKAALRRHGLLWSATRVRS